MNRRNSYVKLIKRKKSEHVESMQKELSSAKCIKEFWGLISKYRGKKRKACPITLKAWEDFYKAQFPAVSDEGTLFHDCRHPDQDA